MWCGNCFLPLLRFLETCPRSQLGPHSAALLCSAACLETLLGQQPWVAAYSTVLFSVVQESNMKQCGLKQKFILKCILVSAFVWECTKTLLYLGGGMCFPQLPTLHSSLHYPVCGFLCSAQYMQLFLHTCAPCFPISCPYLISLSLYVGPVQCKSWIPLHFCVSWGGDARE